MFTKLKNFSWQDWILILFAVIFLSWQLSYMLSFYSIPSQLFGGDQYFHYGHVLHIYNGGSVFESSHFKGEYEHYPWLTHVLVVLLAFVLGSLKAYLVFPFFVNLFGIIVMYFVGKKLFDKTYGLILALLWLAGGDIVVYTHPTATAAVLLLPLFALAYFCGNTKKHVFYSGVVLGLAGIGHIIAFLGGILFFSLKLLAEFNKENLKKYALILFIGILISLFFYYPILFTYKGRVLNNWQEYSGAAIENLNFSYILRNMFPFSFLGIFVALGMFSAFKQRIKLPFLLYVTGFLGVIHPLITKPLIGMSFGFYRFPMWLGLSFALFCLIGLKFIVDRVHVDNKKQAFVFIFLLLFLLNFFKAGSFEQDNWVDLALEEQENVQPFFVASEWILRNTDADKVFISGNPLSAVLLNSLTGRKVTFMYRNHANAFVDLEKRIADSMIILYGKNDVLRKGLIKNYSIGYYYEDFYSIISNVKCTNYWSDLQNRSVAEQHNCIILGPEYEDYLKENGVETKHINTIISPGSGATKFYDRIAVRPVLSSYKNSIYKSNALFVSDELNLKPNMVAVYRVV